MIARCHNRNHQNYDYYGGRGILVCPEWRDSFPAFLAHVGKKPSPTHTIERINNDLGYVPGNVKWGTRREQSNNRRSNRPITIGERTLLLFEWFAELKINPGTFYRRVAAGMSEQEAIQRPSRKHQPVKRWL